MEHERVNVHPLVNSMTTTVSREDLLAFLRDAGHEPMIIRLPEPEGEWTNGASEPMLRTPEKGSTLSLPRTSC